MTRSTRSRSAGSVAAPAPELGIGVQEPRFRSQPPGVPGAAGEVIDLMDQLGHPLDPWQQIVLDTWLGETDAGLWAAFEAALIVARQNGKGGVLEARELGGLILFGDQFIIHSAHQFDTSLEAFQRMKNLVYSRDWLARRVLKESNENGNEGFDFRNGARLRYRTRSTGGGRGFSADLVVIDEAQLFTHRQRAAILPTLSARPNPQVVYTGTVLPEAMLLRSLVNRGRRGGDKRLAYTEWSAEEGADPSEWGPRLQANPAAGIRIGFDYLDAEYASFTENGTVDSPEYLMERLSIWPAVSQIGAVIAPEAWDRCAVEDVRIPESAPISLGLAVSPDRKWSAVAVSWVENGRTMIDLARFQRDTDWLVPFVAAVAGRRGNPAVAVDQGGPAATLLPALGAAGLRVRVAQTADYKTACATFVDGVRQVRIGHRSQPELTEAAVGVKEHRVGDGWVFARRDSATIIAPLEAAALAAWAGTPDPKRKEFFVQNLNDYADAEPAGIGWVRR